jgi:hypothetical protein
MRTIGCGAFGFMRDEVWTGHFLKNYLQSRGEGWSDARIGKRKDLDA